MNGPIQIRIHHCLVFGGLLVSSIASTQNYRAIHGSSYAGGLGAASNPASIVHVPFKWDITLFAVQEAHTTNGFYVDDFSLLSRGKNVEVKGRNESGRRFAFANQDVHLLNARLRLNERQAIAFGINLRSYIHAKTSKFTFSDTASDLRRIMDINRDFIPLEAQAYGTSWAEIYGTFAQTIIEKENSILNAGITLSLTRGLAGGYLRAGNIGFSAVGTQPPRYVLNDAELEYGYSINIDDADAASKGNKRSAFTRRTLSSLSVSAGIEYIVPVIKEGDESNDYHYDLKIGLSVLDLGFNNFMYSTNSRAFVLDGSNIEDTVLEERFDNVNTLENINNTLASLSSSAFALGGYFRVFQPARVVLNVDKNMGGDFFLNGEITVPLTPLLGTKKKAVRDMNMLAITPRLEKKTWGLYLPLTMNVRGQVWLGGAVKAGPVLLGLHNWANLFAKDKIQEGGFYLAVTFRPAKKRMQTSRDRGPKLSREQRRWLECPRF